MRSLPINGKVPTLVKFSLFHFIIVPKVNAVLIVSAGHRTQNPMNLSKNLKKPIRMETKAKAMIAHVSYVQSLVRKIRDQKNTS